jgi:uncharacterized protein YdhG (YjbR/CyaY superfamily)
MAGKPATFDEYLARLGADERRALSALRVTIAGALPGAEERMAYGICAYHLGRMVVGFGASGGRCALYLMSNTTVRDHADLLDGYDTRTGTVRFLPSEPLPKALVRRLVKARLAENAALDAPPAPAAAKRKVRR